ncbi:drug resistance transporter, EmrB/QacA subfamily [Streptomyces sp. DvalAA-14]|uniref:DHA2 family efflux MFS transporter permease subunit n=1 Tax=unclassified Streptomyces TaxID=2593676 RepID=UPI00081B86A2|nr:MULTISPECIES: DHA2 family efflux MFS transporter permease subunit [unclassified Streptomyces]MYS19328.1 DHA2 family efflux MFS transporter permease subunit [Streptomyces sp. SID4948]SCD41930.1 drug resistance transporter, EmrB/QacA subfamily [Streptomyces sp. DvalAA-14]
MAHPSDEGLDPALRRLIGVILLGGIMGILDGSMIAVAADTLVKNFHTSLSAVSWVSTSYLLALTVSIPVTTWAVDRFGGRRLWLLGLVVFLAGSISAGLAWNIGSLITFRVVQGLGAGLLDPLMLTLLARSAGPSRIGRVMGLMGVVGSSGPVFGPVVGGLILQGASWRWMFLVNVPIGLAALVLALRVVPDDKPVGEHTAGKLDVVGLALIGPGVATAVLTLSQYAERTEFLTWRVLVPLAAAVVLLGGYGAHALRARRAPLIDLRLFRSRGFSASVTVGALVGLATFASLFALPLYYQQVRGHDTFASALLLAPLGVGSALSMPLTGRLSDRLGSRRLVLGGAVLAGLSALGFTQLAAGTSQVWSAALAFTIGLGLGSVGAPTIASLYRTLPGHLVPQGSTVLYMLNQLGAAIGIALVALLVQSAGSGDALGGFQAAYWGVTGALVLVVLAATQLPGRPAPRETAHELPAEDGLDDRTAQAPASLAAQGDSK